MNWFKKALWKLRRRRPRSMPDARELYEMVRLTPFFRDVPEQNLREMLKVSEPLRVRDADVIVRDGEEGDYYYMVLDGMASVIRRRTPDEEPRVAAVLAPGFAFGEEALISNARRNATVIMETHGILLRIPKNAFLDHIVASLVTTITPGEANRLIGEGAKWLDVRSAAERRRSHLQGSLSLPLEELRERLDELDPSLTYICCCENGRLSATAAFLMRLAGYKAVVLQGGLRLLERRFRE